MAEEDIERRSCILLESELQDFLAKLLGLPPNRSLPDQYTANLGSVTSYDALTMRKNELLQLLKEYHHLPPKMQVSILKSAFMEDHTSTVPCLCWKCWSCECIHTIMF